MSLRQPSAAVCDHRDGKPKAAAGSIFGPAIGCGIDDLWSSMAISPPRTPPSAPIASPSPPPFDIDDSAVLSEGEVFPGEALVEGVVTMHDCVGLDGVALVRFAQETNASTLLLGASSPRVRNYDYVVGKPVLADAVSWKPMSAPDGLRGHLFTLEHQGRPSSRIEVFLGPQGRLERAAVVDASHSALAVASGIADPSAMLEYAQPERHLAELRALAQRMRTDNRIGYVPVLELCVGEALEALPLGCCGAEPTALVQAHAAWATTRRFLGEMSCLAAEGARRHAATELTQAGATAGLGSLDRAWSDSVVV